jgi:hypothetical protein
MRDATLHPVRRTGRTKPEKLKSASAQEARGAFAAVHSAPMGIFKLAAVCLLILPLGACSLSRTAKLESEQALVTSSISKPVAAEGVDSTDVEVIKNMVTSADGETMPELAWSNPDTGSRGTIKAIDQFVGSHGQTCKKFQTTVDSFTGISLYNGETCETKKDSWVVSWFLRE